jgi:hypothetical protein
MANESAGTKRAVYEANVQQYRVLSATVQSFLVTIGSIFYTQEGVPNFLMILTATLGLLHIRFIWFDVVRARHLVIDYYKFQHYQNLTVIQTKELNDKYPEARYIHDVEARREVNKMYFKRPDLKLWRETRKKLDIVVPTGYALIWLSLLAWKQPWHLPLW